MTTNGYLDRAALLAKAKSPRRYADFNLPSGGTVRIQSLSERERSEYESKLLDKKGTMNRNALLEAKRSMVVLCLVDGEGERILSEGDIGALAHMDSADIDALCSACRKHCRFDDEDFEALIKNSETVHAEDSPSD